MSFAAKRDLGLPDRCWEASPGSRHPPTGDDRFRGSTSTIEGASLNEVARLQHFLCNAESIARSGKAARAALTRVRATGTAALDRALIRARESKDDIVGPLRIVGPKSAFAPILMPVTTSSGLSIRKFSPTSRWTTVSATECWIEWTLGSVSVSRKRRA